MLEASLILVNYRCEDETRTCLDHLKHLGASRPGQRIVFDNSPERGLGASPGIKELCDHFETSSTNLGFAAAVNRAAARAHYPVLILLNPDALPDARCLTELVKTLHDNPKIGLAGPNILPTKGQTPLPSATRIEPNVLTTLIEYSFAHRIFDRGWLNRNYFVDPKLGRQPCASLQGACLAIRRSLFEQLGGLDERFFFYWEDTDFSARANDLGYQALYCPDLFCCHKGGRSLTSQEIKEAFFWQGLFAYHRQRGGLRRELLLRSILPPAMLLELCTLLCIDRLRGGKDAVLREDIATHRRRLKQQLRLKHPPYLQDQP